tara:strand:+ start:431 stop:676 length:246 start_codon:yes stop_codon:yes gene_type:complete
MFLNKFPCTSCGICCKLAGRLHAMPQREDGACAFLTEDNKCSVYIFRPEFCRIKKDFKENALLCNKFQEQFNIDKKYKVIL